jgi:hypothetical protein
VQALFVAITNTERCPIRLALGWSDLAAPFPIGDPVNFFKAMGVYELF